MENRSGLSDIADNNATNPRILIASIATTELIGSDVLF